MRDFASVTAPVRDGKPVLSIAQRKIMEAAFRKLDGKDCRIAISPRGKSRSDNQNKYYWGVILTMIAAETGNSTEDLHDVFREMFLPRSYVSLAGKEVQVRKSTAILDTFMFEGYLEQIRAFAAAELNMTIPLPDEIY
jgi:hypothetical protein